MNRLNDPRRASPLAAFLILAAGMAGGCRLARTVAEAPVKVVAEALPGGKQEPRVDPGAVAVRLMRFGDVFAAEIRQATEEFARLAGTQAARTQALAWRVDYTSAGYRLATSPRPFGGVFDAIVVTTALRAAHEERWLPVWGEVDRPMLESLARLEEGAWSLAAEALTAEQVEQVRVVVRSWLGGDPADRLVDLARLPGFADLAGSAEQGATGVVAELTDLVRLDPLSSLDPAVREVEQARQLGERLFYFAQRLPDLLAARVELLALRSTQAEPMNETLASWERISRAAESLAATAESLPAELTAERTAAIGQISAELSAQREALVRDLETARAPLSELLEETRSTAEAGRSMSEALTGTLFALDAFVERFDQGEEPAGAEPAGRPFDVTEYGDAAGRIGTAAQELAETIATLERSLPEVQRVLDEVAARGERSLDHAFRLGLGLLGAALGGWIAAVLLVRRISLRWERPGRSRPRG